MDVQAFFVFAMLMICRRAVAALLATDDLYGEPSTSDMEALPPPRRVGDTYICIISVVGNDTLANSHPCLSWMLLISETCLVRLRGWRIGKLK